MRISYTLLCCLVLLFVAARAGRAMDGVGQNGGNAPEPASIVMVGIGLAAGGYAVHRNRRARARRIAGPAFRSRPEPPSGFPAEPGDAR